MVSGVLGVELIASQVDFRNLMWVHYIDRFLEPRREELRTNRIRMKYFWGYTITTFLKKSL